MENKNHLYILWTNDNAITSEKMVFMYGINSLKKGWWENVSIIVWGATAQLVSRDSDIQKLIQKAMSAGVKMLACKACADQLGISDVLEKMGIEVMYTGELLTGILKSGQPLLTI